MDWRHSRPLRISFLLIVTLIALLGILPYFLSSDLVRDQLIMAVQRDTQRKLDIRGSAHVVLLPRPAVLIKNATLTEPNDSTVFAHADTIKMVFRLWPLLSEQKAVARSIEIERPELTIIRHEDGSYNFEDLLQNKGQLIQVALDRLTFSDAQFSWHDEFLNQTLNFQQFDLEMNDLTDPKKGALDLNGEIFIGNKGESTLWRGQIHGSGAMRYIEQERRLHIANIKMAINQNGQSDDQVKINNLALQITGNLNYGWDPLRLTGGDLKLVGSGRRSGQNWQTTLDIPEIKLTSTSLILHRLKVDVEMQDKNTKFIASASIPTLSGAHSQLLQSNAAKISVKYTSPEQNLDVLFSTPLIIERGTITRLPNYRLTGSYTNRSLPRGAVRLDLTGKGDLDLHNELINLDSNGTLDYEALRAQIGMESFLDPHFRVNIDLAKLDLTPYLPAVAAGAKNINEKNQFDFWWLNQLSAIGSIKVGELVLNNLHIDDIDATLIARKNRLVLDPLKATLYEGQLSGRIEINASKDIPYFRVEQTLSNMNINTLLTDTFDTSRFEGRSNLTLDVTATGNNITALRKSANGKIKASLKEGAIRGIDISGLLSAASQQIKLMNGEIKKIDHSAGKTNFSELNATLILKNGVAVNDDLIVSADVLKLKGGGTLNLNAGTIDYAMLASANPKVPELSGLLGLSLPLTFRGPLNNPVFNADTANLKEQIIARQQAEAAAKTAKIQAAEAAKKAAAQAAAKKKSAPVKKSTTPNKTAPTKKTSPQKAK
ncbi:MULTISPECIES: AsmA family protein [Deefgea]|uniref:AsmA family protein n=1 Tax=Deefgea chitinilytica TaxID=570276 RepID=A0ABS2CAN2_9NEIS|nr:MULTISPECIES: AsmA family protein [Deefgea]MBM5571213.1 AsmA family protein [Deefgea chitinilytica]MBM9888445.1 AsmA family protein [Deefgea sp. CFH1-16]